MKSAIYIGNVRHHRTFPKEHAFAYRLFMAYLDLDELPELFNGSWIASARRPALVYFRRADYLGSSAMPLKQAVYALVKKRLNMELDGPVRLLTHLRYFGHGFNPVSFYYCYDKTGATLKAIIAEINNTPWGEQYCYVMDVEEATVKQRLKKFSMQKVFHISPFMSLDYQYEWLFSFPHERLYVHMKNWRDGACHFTATLDLTKQDFSHKNLRKALLDYPFMTLKVLLAIYWQALRLWFKKTPFHAHPHNSLEREK